MDEENSQYFLDSRIVMNVRQERYYGTNRFLLTTVGVWPYQSKTSSCVALIIFLITTSAAIVTKVLKRWRVYYWLALWGIYWFWFSLDSFHGVSLAGWGSGDWVHYSHISQLYVLHKNLQLSHQFSEGFWNYQKWENESAVRFFRNSVVGENSE